MKVYIVTSGSYSDYSINCVFSTKEKAEEWIDAWKPQAEYCDEDDYRIEEYEADAEPKATPHTRVTMDKYGTAIKTRHFQAQGGRGFGGFCSHKGDFAQGPDAPCFEWTVETDDETRAIKVVNEKRTQILALNLWGDWQKCSQLFGDPS